MIRILSLLLLGFFSFTSCSLGGGTVYYPKNHLVALFSEVGSGKTTFLNWGDKLVYLNRIMTNTNKVGQPSYYVNVKNPIDNSTGYVDIDNLIKDPVSRCVIVNNTIVYETPTVVSRNKQNVIPPVLAYVVEIKDTDWSRIEPYNARAVYTLTNDASALFPVHYDWISPKDYSTNQGDVDIVIALQLAVKKYNESKKIYDSTPDEKNLKSFQEALKPEVDNIRKVLEKYPQANMGVYNEVQKFLEVASPLVDGVDMQTNVLPGDTNGNNGGSEEEL